MKKEEKVLKIIENVYNKHPLISFSFNKKKNSYEIVGMRFSEGVYSIEIFINHYKERNKAENTIIMLYGNNENIASTIGTKNIDGLIEALKDSWLDYLTEGIK